MYEIKQRGVCVNVWVQVSILEKRNKTKEGKRSKKWQSNIHPFNGKYESSGGKKWIPIMNSIQFHGNERARYAVLSNIDDYFWELNKHSRYTHMWKNQVALYIHFLFSFNKQKQTLKANKTKQKQKQKHTQFPFF